MKNTLKTWVRRIKGNEKGVAALLAVVLAIVVIGTIAFSFLAQTEQKSSGSALTYTSTNAYLVAEAGLRYAEKCLLLGSGTSCPCESWTSKCDDWSDTNVASFSSITFGDTRGSFVITFPADSENTSTQRLVRSTGTFAESIRSLSKFVAKVCFFTENAVTSCTPIITNNNAGVEPETATVVDGECDIPALPTLTFPSSLDSCPGTGDTGPPVGGGELCSWTQSSGSQTIDGDVNSTVWIKGDFTLTSTAELTINGDVTINVGGNMLMQTGAPEIKVVGGSLTIQIDGNFTMGNNSKINNTDGDVVDAFVMVGGTGTLSNNITFIGGLYGGDMDLDLDNNAEIEGSIVANSVTLNNNTTLVYDETAGTGADGYSTCGGGGTSSVPTEG